MPNDIEAYRNVRQEALAGAGASFVLRSVISMLDGLLAAHPADFSLDGALDALDSMARYAEHFAFELRKASGCAKPKGVL